MRRIAARLLDVGCDLLGRSLGALFGAALILGFLYVLMQLGVPSCAPGASCG